MRIVSGVDRIAGLEPGVHVLRMLENFSRGFHPEMEGYEIINKIITK